jgi:hypothetical protein
LKQSTKRSIDFMVIKCTCNHEQQDEMYGKFSRVHNPIKKSPNQPQEYRCTVCGKVRKEN